MGTEVECTVCGDTVCRGPNGFGLIQHSNSHRREFIDKYGREPETYDEVRERLGIDRPDGYADDQLTLAEAISDDTSLWEFTDNQRNTRKPR